jgi:Fic family protein
MGDAVAAKKAQLDGLRPLPPEALSNLEHYYDVEITYTSNAIEGNTLSPIETTLVIEQGVTIAGKPLKDHLEALDHYDAIRDVRALAREQTPLTESDVRNLHRLVVQRSRPDLTRPLCRPSSLCSHRNRALRISLTGNPGADG